MKNQITARILFPSQVAVLALASAIAIPAMAQQTQQPDSSQSAPAAAQQTPTSTPPAAVTNTPTEAKEGFWGRVNPMARKKWVKKRLDPINDRLTELDQVNAKNASDIKDVDSRAQAGIKKAQDSADQANQVATAAGDAAKKANDTATTASGHVDTLNTTVAGLDSYKPISDVEVPFRTGSPVLSKDAKAKLDDMAKSLEGHQGYIIEIEARSPGAGAAGITSSQREAAAVQRYLVTEHEIPVYRMHSVALGNAQITEPTTDVASNNAPADQTAPKPVAAHHRERVPSTVHIKLMENSLAAQGTTSPHGMASSTGAVQQ
ncbi:OmpA family protein [Telmatobacter sp. DSM 110680]|uniref:OmpA family protein n=1 Tax=Telmatobacter sp. DSM 110680 TaxID=3036704 RepID=A0AAU7DRB0_9BACT